MFSELKMIEKETGLTFDDETGILYGTKNNIPIAVFDNTSKHRFDIICGAFISNDFLNDIYALTEGFPKKTVLGAECSNGVIKVYCDSFGLMQERLFLLMDFLEKLTFFAAKNKRAVTELDKRQILELQNYVVLSKKNDNNKIRSDKKPKPRKNFDIKPTLKGLLGGFIGFLVGSSLFVTFIMLSDIIGWLGGIVMAAAVISLYSAFSRRMKTFDVIASSLLTIAGWLFSNGFAYLFRLFLLERETNPGLNIIAILSDIGAFTAKHKEIANLMSNELLVNFVFVAAGAIGSFWFYYSRNEHDQF